MVLGLILFNIFINDLDEGIERLLIKFADDTKLGGVANTQEDRVKIQQELNTLEKWAVVNRMQFNKDKCMVLHLGHKNVKHQYWMGETLLGNSVCERDLGVRVDCKLNMSSQCDLVTKKANSLLGCISKAIASKSRERSLPHFIQLWSGHT